MAPRLPPSLRPHAIAAAVLAAATLAALRPSPGRADEERVRLHPLPAASAAAPSPGWWEADVAEKRVFAGERAVLFYRPSWDDGQAFDWRIVGPDGREVRAGTQRGEEGGFFDRARGDRAPAPLYSVVGGLPAGRLALESRATPATAWRAEGTFEVLAAVVRWQGFVVERDIADAVPAGAPGRARFTLKPPATGGASLVFPASIDLALLSPGGRVPVEAAVDRARGADLRVEVRPVALTAGRPPGRILASDAAAMRPAELGPALRDPRTIFCIPVTLVSEGRAAAFGFAIYSVEGGPYDGPWPSAPDVEAEPAPQATIRGPARVRLGEVAALTGEVEGGRPPFVRRWRIGGRILERKSISFRASWPKTYEVSFLVTDAAGREARATNAVDVVPDPLVVEIAGDSGRAKAMARAPVRLEAVARGGVPPFTYRWTVDGEARHEGPALEVGFAQPGPHVVAVAATDSRGAGPVAAEARIDVAARGTHLKARAEHPEQITLGDPAIFRGFAQGGIPPYDFRWIAGGQAFAGPELVLDLELPGSYPCRLYVTDSGFPPAQQIVEFNVAAKETK